MVKVLTIRDPKTGALIAEEQLGPRDDRDEALVRVFRKALGADAPELVVLRRSVWLDDREWADQLANDWGRFLLFLLGPKGSRDLKHAHLVLASVSERSPASRMEFPADRDELKKIREGKLHDALVPVPPDTTLAVGDTITFLEAASGSFGPPIVLPDGESVSVDLTGVRKRADQWAGRDLYDITWDPKLARVSPKRAPARASRR